MDTTFVPHRIASDSGHGAGLGHRRLNAPGCPETSETSLAGSSNHTCPSRPWLFLTSTTTTTKSGCGGARLRQLVRAAGSSASPGERRRGGPRDLERRGLGTALLREGRPSRAAEEGIRHFTAEILAVHVPAGLGGRADRPCSTVLARIDRGDSEQAGTSSYDAMREPRTRRVHWPRRRRWLDHRGHPAGAAHALRDTSWQAAPAATALGMSARPGLRRTPTSTATSCRRVFSSISRAHRRAPARSGPARVGRGLPRPEADADAVRRRLDQRTVELGSGSRHGHARDRERGRCRDPLSISKRRQSSGRHRRRDHRPELLVLEIDNRSLHRPGNIPVPRDTTTGIRLPMSGYRCRVQPFFDQGGALRRRGPGVSVGLWSWETPADARRAAACRCPPVISTAYRLDAWPAAG